MSSGVGRSDGSVVIGVNDNDDVVTVDEVMVVFVVVVVVMV